MRHWQGSDTSYPAVRRVMGPKREQLDDAAVEHLLGELFPGVEPEDVEDFMGSLQGFAKQAAPLARQALPGAIQGAQQGAMVAGPWGALAGAVGGGAASLMGGRAQGTAPTPAQPGNPAAPAGQGAPSPQVAAAELLALLSRPETQQALLALLMSGAGRSTVQVGTTPVPTHAFANAISEIAARVAEATDMPASEVSGYLVDSEGNPRGDIVNPAERARLLLGDLAVVAAAEAEQDIEDESFADPIGDNDPLDSYEAAVEGRSL